MKALVTGANGFVGSHLCAHLLANGDRVRVLVRASADLSALAGLDVERAVGDVTDRASIEAALDGIDVVFHVAGGTKAVRAGDLFAVNAGGCANVARAASRRTTPPVVVMTSSLAAAGPSPDWRSPRDEAHAPAPVSNYGRSKLAGERAARAWGGVVPLSIVRPPMVYGPWDRGALELFKLAARRIAPRVGFTGERRFSSIHGKDLVVALRLVAERGERVGPAHPAEGEDASRGVYFADDGGRHRWEDWIGAAAAALGVRAAIVPVPEVATFLAGAWGELVGQLTGKASFVNLDKAREGRAAHWVCDAGKIVRDLGFRPRIPLRDGFAETGRFYVENGWLGGRKRTHN